MKDRFLAKIPKKQKVEKFYDNIWNKEIKNDMFDMIVTENLSFRELYKKKVSFVEKEEPEELEPEEIV
jgi:hypothetical protein